jgi:hypothetical protein
MTFFYRARDARHLRVRLLAGHARLEEGDGDVVMLVVERLSLGRPRHRYPQRFSRQRRIEAGRHHTNDGVGASAEMNLATDDTAVGGEARRPEPMRENRDLVVAGLVLLGDKGAPEQWPCAEHAKELMRHPAGRYALRRVSVGEIEVREALGSERLE